MAVTDKDKNEIFKQLLKYGMKNHKTESSVISELQENVENETKASLNTKGDFEQLAVVVTAKEFDENLIVEKKHALGRIKFATNSLKSCLRMLKPLPVSSYLAPLITRMFQLTGKNPRLKLYQSKAKTDRRPKTTGPLVLQIV